MKRNSWIGVLRRIGKMVLTGFVVSMASLPLMTGAQAAELRQLKVNIAFLPHNLPLFAAMDQGFLAQRGLSVELVRTLNSQQQRDGLANGSFDIVHTAVDNAVSMVNAGRGDAVIVMGGDNGMNQLLVRPEIKTYEDIRGKTVVVDAVDTAYALQLYKMLELRGLRKGDYVIQSVGAGAQRVKAMLENPAYIAGMLSPHTAFIVEEQGFHSLGTAVDVVGRYQGMGGFVMRAWAKENADALSRYIQASIAGYRWAADPANRKQAAALLVKHLNISPAMAERSVEAAIGPRGGVDKDVALDVEGFRSTLKLRADFQGQPDNVPAPDRYIDLSYYQKAAAGIRP